MNINWGYSPKVEKHIPLGDFPADKYLIVAKHAIENLGWKVSHVSQSGIIAYTPISFQSYSEEITIRIHGNFAVVKSECVGIQMLFNDYGKNALNLEKLFHEFEYVEFHLATVWDDIRCDFNHFIATQDDTYFEKAPLATKDKIKNVLYLFWPQKGYVVTPILVLLNVVYYCIMIGLLSFYIKQLQHETDFYIVVEKMKAFMLGLGANNRNLVLDGEYWRLISCQYIHGSFMHLFFNMYALVYLGLMLENKLNWKKFLLIYFLSGICASLLSITHYDEGVMVGASGTVMGLYGAFLAILLNKQYEKHATKSLFISTLIVVALIIFNGLNDEKIDNSAHFGGLLSGFAFAYILTFKTGQKPVFDTLKYGFIAVLFVIYSLAIVVFTPNYQHQEFLQLKAEFDENCSAYTDARITPGMLQSEQMEQVNEFGILPSEQNLAVVKRMAMLNINKKDSRQRDLITNLAKKSYEEVLALKKIIVLNQRLRYQLIDKIEDINELQAEYRDSLQLVGKEE
jgi:rhomboid protease GluP